MLRSSLSMILNPASSASSGTSYESERKCTYARFSLEKTPRRGLSLTEVTAHLGSDTGGGLTKWFPHRKMCLSAFTLDLQGIAITSITSSRFEPIAD